MKEVRGLNEEESKATTSRVLYWFLAALGIAGIFFVGVLLGRALSASGRPGASIARQLRSRILRQIQPQTPTPLPTATRGTVEVPRLSTEEVKERLDSGADLAIVDVRIKETFDETHVKGAISIPLSELEARYAELPKDREIIIYCSHC